MARTAVRAQGSLDGRHAWRERNRNAVVDALLDLYQEGIAAPSADDIASRSGVSRRSLFRYFDDMDELCRVAIDRQYNRVQHLFPIESFAEGSLDERLDALVSQRVRLFKAIAPVARIARSRAPLQPILQKQLRSDGARLRAQLERQFARELDLLDMTKRLRTLAAADVLTCFEAFDVLTSRQSLSLEEAAAVMRGGLASLLAPAG
jgi:AcrR family transcriptional regulator